MLINRRNRLRCLYTGLSGHVTVRVVGYGLAWGCFALFRSSGCDSQVMVVGCAHEAGMDGDPSPARFSYFDLIAYVTTHSLTTTWLNSLPSIITAVSWCHWIYSYKVLIASSLIKSQTAWWLTVHNQPTRIGLTPACCWLLVVEKERGTEKERWHRASNTTQMCNRLLKSRQAETLSLHNYNSMQIDTSLSVRTKTIQRCPCLIKI
jgi:hypothetical protein